MQSTLLEALVDPSRKTPKALDTLLATSFAHFIDSSSLALVSWALLLSALESALTVWRRDRSFLFWIGV